MTDAKRWPNNAAYDRDEAADRLNAIIRRARQLRNLATSGAPTREEIIYLVGLILDDAQTGVRHLERHGARTVPQSRDDGPNGN